MATAPDPKEPAARAKAEDEEEPEPTPEELGDAPEVGEDLPARIADRGGAALSRRDPLQAYMRDVQRFPLLTPEEEQELSRRYAEHGDLDAARRLVTSNLRLVVKIAYGYRRAYQQLLDLVQEGNIGLVQAVQKFDPYRGVKLSTYAAWWIRAYILRFILNNWRLVKLGTTQAQRKLFFNLSREKARLTALGIEPTADRIAKALDVPEEEVVQMDRRLAAGDASLQAPVGGEGDGRQVTRMDLLASKAPAIDEVLASAQVDDLLHEKIQEFAETLEGKEKRIFEKRLLADEPLTLQELGAEFGISRERVRQLEKRLLDRLKRYLGERVDEDVLDIG